MEYKALKSDQKLWDQNQTLLNGLSQFESTHFELYQNFFYHWQDFLNWYIFVRLQVEADLHFQPFSPRILIVIDLWLDQAEILMMEVLLDDLKNGWKSRISEKRDQNRKWLEV